MTEIEGSLPMAEGYVDGELVAYRLTCSICGTRASVVQFAGTAIIDSDGDHLVLRPTRAWYEPCGHDVPRKDSDG